MTRFAPLEAWFGAIDQALLGYSGGVDSALLAAAGSRALGPGRFLAVIGVSPSYPEVQWALARDLARRFQIPLLEVSTDELLDPDYRRNPTDRCYFCKRELWSKLQAVAQDRGFRVIIDGTNADDLTEHRPGAVAGREFQVRSPLVELGWTKAMVRAAAREIGIESWSAPAAPCLSSRIRYGLEVTRERLAQVERCEAFLRELGVVGDLRVRHHGGEARIEARPAMFGLIDASWPAVTRFFAELGFTRVTRDPAGYRRGSLLPVAGGVQG